MESRWISSPFLLSWGLRLLPQRRQALLDLELESGLLVARQGQRSG